MRDLFEAHDGGWLQNPGLLDRLVTEKLEREAEVIRAEGWRWTEVATEFPYGHTNGLCWLVGEKLPLTAEEIVTQEALQAELEQLEQTYAEADDVPEEVDHRLSEIETALAAFEERPVIYDPADRGLIAAAARVSATCARCVRDSGWFQPSPVLRYPIQMAGR